MTATPFGFRIVGSCNEDRRLVDHAAAFSAYCSCDELAKVEREAYLSAFQFGDDFRTLLDSTGSCRGFEGVCWSPWLWFDIDRADLDAAHRDACRLAGLLVERYRLDEDALLMFFSGSKGFHVGLPTALWGPEPSPDFHRVCRRLAEALGVAVGIVIDSGVYDRVRAFRAPNSRHPKTGLFKRRFTLDELTGLALDAVLKLASKPEAFEVSARPEISERAKTDWQEAQQAVERARQANARRSIDGKATLNRLTLDFIRQGADLGDRHRLLYSAARNLGEFGCPPALGYALLSEPALDCGLAPRDVRRQIECGLNDEGPAVEADPLPSPTPSVDADELRDQLARLWAPPAMPKADVDPPEHPEGDGRSDAWEHPADQLNYADMPPDGPYSKEGGRQ